MIGIRGKSGFTLAEVLVAMSIGIISLTSGFMLLEIGYKYLDHSMSLADVQRDSRIAMERMFKEIQESKVSTATLGTGSTSVSFASARNSSNAFQFDQSGNPSWQKAVVYYLDAEAKKLYRYETAKTDWSTNYNPNSAIGNPASVVVVPNVISLQFGLSSNLASVSLTVSKDTRAGKATEPLSTTVKLRN